MRLRLGPEGAVRLALQVEIVQVEGMDRFGRPSLMEPARAGKHGLEELFAQDQQAGQSADAQSSRRTVQQIHLIRSGEIR
jgi:hypothetical protein